MAKKPKHTIISKKHLARLEKEQLQQRWILIVSIAVIVLIVGLIGYGLLDQYYLRDLRTVANVNGEKITLKEFESNVRYRRRQLVGTAINTYEYLKLFGDSPEIMASFASQLDEFQYQLTPAVVGQQVLDQMIEASLIRQEAIRRGITVTDEEIDKEIREAYEFYPGGTPTASPTLPPQATSTLSAGQLAMMRPTSTTTATLTATTTPLISTTETIAATLTPTVVTPTAIPTSTPIPSPTMTATPFTQESFEQLFEQTLTDLKESIDFSEEDLREVVRTRLYYMKLLEEVLKDVTSREQEQVWARHLLVKDEQLAKDLRSRLEKGEDWFALTAQYSEDTSNKDNGGDLGWFASGQMVPEFEQAAFALLIGETSQPIQTQFGWHIIQVLGHEMRPISDSDYQQMRETKFQEYVNLLSEQAEITTSEFWKISPPELPAFPEEISQFIASIQESQQQPVLLETPPAPVP